MHMMQFSERVSVLRVVATMVALGTVALAAFLAVPGSAYACSYAFAPTPLTSLDRSGIAAIVTVELVNDTEVVLAPQAFLKGPASREPIVFRRPADVRSSCDAEFTARSRVLLFIPASGSSWPSSDMAFILKDGFVEQFGQRGDPEAKVIAEIRNITGQYAVPAANAEEGATLDWKKVVIPVGLATLAIFVISLVMMRTWHRIDPS